MRPSPTVASSERAFFIPSHEHTARTHSLGRARIRLHNEHSHFAFPCACGAAISARTINRRMFLGSVRQCIPRHDERRVLWLSHWKFFLLLGLRASNCLCCALAAPIPEICSESARCENASCVSSLLQLVHAFICDGGGNGARPTCSWTTEHCDNHSQRSRTTLKSGGRAPEQRDGDNVVPSSGHELPGVLGLVSVRLDDPRHSHLAPNDPERGPGFGAAHNVWHIPDPSEKHTRYGGHRAKFDDCRWPKAPHGKARSPGRYVEDGSSC
mmetsp:Transcript_40354/g.94442  ORF Transcript_40354/g.94442 Transcript_40354/m.94442 type:complete len:269 (+) Transcript_40354:159-965(+)